MTALTPSITVVLLKCFIKIFDESENIFLSIAQI